jgi:hypothetical protein
VLRTIRRWFLKFGSVIAANLRRTRVGRKNWIRGTFPKSDAMEDFR